MEKSHILLLKNDQYQLIKALETLGELVDKAVSKDPAKFQKYLLALSDASTRAGHLQTRVAHYIELTEFYNKATLERDRYKEKLKLSEERCQQLIETLDKLRAQNV
jgi:hypothetical protein